MERVNRRWTALVSALIALLLASAVRVDWGAKVSPIEWLSAVATAGALGVTVVLLKSELDDAARRRMADDQAEARLVSTWIRMKDEDGGGGAVVVRSRASEPVYDLRAAVQGLGLTFSEFTGLDEPADGRVGYMTAVMPPGSDLEAWFDVLWTGGPLSVDLEFTDAAGRHWRRETTGRLHQIESRDLRHCWNPENAGDPELW